MCSCSYLGSPCAAECAIPARPRCGVAYVSRPRGGVAHVSTASPRDEVALFSPGVRSCAHPRLGEVPGEHALPPRGARARGGSKLTVPRALPRLRSSRREAPRRGGTCCPGAPAPPTVRRPSRAPAHFSLTFGSPAGNFVNWEQWIVGDAVLEMVKARGESAAFANVAWCIRVLVCWRR